MGKQSGPNSVDQSGIELQESDAVAGVIPGRQDQPKVVYRLSGDAYLLVEYGELVLDLNLRFRAHFLEQAIISKHIEGLLETVPGVRSLLIKYDGLQLPLKKLLETLKSIEKELPPVKGLEISSRVVHLPIAFHDRWTLDAIAQYISSVRDEAPYLPDNVEFVARCNGLENIEKVAAYLTSTQIMVIGLGDVYLGAPCAVPLDPRYRLVTPKYNPARMFTPEGAVGIGGAFICIYPMESPGGYQLVGRTLPIWNAFQTTPPFAEEPWLLRFFDRIQFELVSEKELETARDEMLSGHYPLRIEEGAFSIGEYNEFIQSVRDETEIFNKKQKEAADIWMKGY